MSEITELPVRDWKLPALQQLVDVERGESKLQDVKVINLLQLEKQGFVRVTRPEDNEEDYRLEKWRVALTKEGWDYLARFSLATPFKDFGFKLYIEARVYDFTICASNLDEAKKVLCQDMLKMVAQLL